MPGPQWPGMAARLVSIVTEPRERCNQAAVLVKGADLAFERCCLFSAAHRRLGLWRQVERQVEPLLRDTTRS